MKQVAFPFEHKLRRHWLSCASLMVVVTISAAAQGIPSRFPVTSAQIVVAMENRQLPTEGVEVKISAPITASREQPPLEIQTIELLNAHTAQIKMACRNRTECLPFYVSAVWPEASALQAIPPSIRRVGSIQTETKQEQSQPKVGISKPDALKPEESQTVHAGTAAMLTMDKDRIHILVRVVCLEGGIAGDRVRVTTPDHKQAYVAEIVSPTLLKGSF